jgi:hypothetical protein
MNICVVSNNPIDVFQGLLSNQTRTNQQYDDYYRSGSLGYKRPAPWMNGCKSFVWKQKDDGERAWSHDRLSLER